MMKVLVTGGAGFIGSNLADYLAEKGHSVRILDIKRREGQGSLPKVVTQIIGDITRRETVREALSGVEVVFHLASLVTEVNVTHDDYWKVNVDATCKLLEESKRAGIKRFVYCSTDNVSGKIKHPPAKERDCCYPENIYGITKYEAEKKVLEFQKNLEVVIARPTRTYGPRDMRMLEIFKKIKQRRFLLVGSGNILFHPVYITDLIKGLELCAISKGASGEIFYLGGESPVPLKQFLGFAAECLEVKLSSFTIPVSVATIGVFLIENICSILKVKPPLTRRSLEFFIRARAYDISKAKRLLGYKPEISFQEGIKKTIDWYRKGGYI